ncbi:uncharacterized protein METZ01_LOCUS358073, partial [marine metagenome]
GPTCCGGAWPRQPPSRRPGTTVLRSLLGPTGIPDWNATYSSCVSARKTGAQAHRV